uniref:Uncharacterized protein n=1 Tax=Solanum lycopersicum TaxID=4081 RepID=A0A3Q7IU38_SOLLC
MIFINDQLPLKFESSHEYPVYLFGGKRGVPDSKRRVLHAFLQAACVNLRCTIALQFSQGTKGVAASSFGGLAANFPVSAKTVGHPTKSKKGL